jgi:hypothetical protein
LSGRKGGEKRAGRREQREERRSGLSGLGDGR